MRHPRFLPLFAALVLAAAALLAYGFGEARRDPVVRHARIAFADWPRDARPLRIALAADIHLGSLAMDEARLARAVDTINAAHPELIVLAGDFINGHDAGMAALQGAALSRQLARLHARFGVVAVLGNHDHWTGAAAVAGALRRAHVTLLVNGAIARGPLAIGGVDDGFTGHARTGATLAAMQRLPGAKLLLSHTPDIAAELPPGGPPVLAGHTHCGQVVLPVVGAPLDVSLPRYRCGRVADAGRTVIVTAGLGTSHLPLRLGAPPDIWIVTADPRHGSSNNRSRFPRFQ